jgi:hypothetical protein
VKIDNAGELDVVSVCLAQPERDIFQNINVSAISVVEARCIDEMDCEVAIRARVDLNDLGICRILNKRFSKLCGSCHTRLQTMANLYFDVRAFGYESALSGARDAHDSNEEVSRTGNTSVIFMAFKDAKPHPKAFVGVVWPLMCDVGRNPSRIEAAFILELPEQ